MRNTGFIRGVEIISKNIPESEKNGWGIQAAHDQIWFGAYNWVTDEEEIKELEELGWFEDEDSWSCTT